jgi:hypothetical protein
MCRGRLPREIVERMPSGPLPVADGSKVDISWRSVSAAGACNAAQAGGDGVVYELAYIYYRMIMISL